MPEEASKPVVDKSVVVDGTTVTFKKEAAVVSPPDLELAMALINGLTSRLDRIERIMRNHAIY